MSLRETLERERKLDAESGFTLPELPGRALAERVFTSTYYDTPTRSLSRAGITLRLRVDGEKSVWQLKLPRPGRGNVRTELEAAGGPDGPPAELQRLLVTHLRKGGLEPIAVLQTHRSGVRVEDDGRAIADVTIDEVDVVDGEGFTELEIELVDGDDADLDRLEEVLLRAGARRGSDTPKVLRVVQLEAEPPLSGVAAQLAALEMHDPGVRLGSDPEDLRQFEIAARRAGTLVDALSGELAWLASLTAERQELLTAMSSSRYFELLDALRRCR
jgi:adenylate cyclase class IV